MEFEWDPEKAEHNLHKHGVSFPEASTAFGDPLSLTKVGTDTSGEERFILVGQTLAGRLVLVVHTDRDETTRIISARLATASERRSYEHS